MVRQWELKEPHKANLGILSKDSINKEDLGKEFIQAREVWVPNKGSLPSKDNSRSRAVPFPSNKEDFHLSREASLHNKDLHSIKVDLHSSSRVDSHLNRAAFHHNRDSLLSKAASRHNREASLHSKAAFLHSSSSVSLPKPPMDLDQLN